MNIYIPTHKRYHRQITWNNLPDEVRSRTKLVIAHGEAPYYSKDLPVVETPEGLAGIGATRQWILDNAEDDHVVMLDDDLTFAVRRSDNVSLFKPSTDKDVVKVFDDIDKLLEQYAHVTMQARENGNRNTALFSECGRAMRVLCFDMPILRFEGIQFNPDLVQDDFDITLQLLKKGYKNMVIGWIVHNQSGSGATGGASAYRDMNRHNESVKRLATLHPGLVTVVHRHTKVAWGGQPRLDVICQWKQAYRNSVTGLKKENQSE